MRKIILLLAILALSSAFKPSQSPVCSDAEKSVDACFEIYKPVCAIDTTNGQTTKVDYSNRCYACKEAPTSLVIDGACDSLPQGANYCRPIKEKLGQQRFCPAVYQPVCGYYKNHIKCIKAPCAVTLSNSCYACLNSDISYYVKGSCESDLKL